MHILHCNIIWNSKYLENKSKYNPIDNLGEYAVKGGPGRPPGTKNRFTLIKQQLSDKEYSDEVLAIFKDWLESKSPRDQREAAKLYFSLFPREDKVEQQISQLVVNKVIHQPAPKNVECPKCKCSIDL